MKINVQELGYKLLIFIAFTRPIISVLEGRTPFPIHKLIPTGLSYLLLILLALSFYRIKWDLIGITIILFCIYAVLSLSWGSSFTSTVELVLPFILYFAGIVYSDNVSKSKKIITFIILGYSIPIIGSAIMMALKLSVDHVVYGSGAIRQYGMFDGFHTAAHSMLLFSYFYAFFLAYRTKMNLFFQYFVHLLFMASFYTLVNTYVRSGLMVFFLFWIMYVFKMSKRYFIILMIIMIGFGVWQSSRIQSVFWKADTWDRERNLETASSGRTILWAHNLKLFLRIPLYKKLLGNGIGSESVYVIGKEDQVWSSHNDYISILMTLGAIGLCLFVSIYVLLIWEIYYYAANPLFKIITLFSIFASLATSMVTNGYTFRFEASQTFWLLIGCSYSLLKSAPKKGLKI